MQYEELVAMWQKQNVQNSSQLETVLNGRIINFAYHSGKIENPNITYNDTREIFENDRVSSYTGDLRTLFEIKNAKDSMNMMMAHFDKKTSLSEALIKEFQKELTKLTYDQRRYDQGERPGQYKKHDYIVGKDEIGASVEDTAEEMQELVEDITSNTLNSGNILKGAAYFHCKMENIHPFSDGNGRVGRLLVNYLLILHNHPPLIFFNEDKNEYYEALGEWDKKLSIDKMVAFLKKELIKSWADHPMPEKTRLIDVLK